MPGPWEAFAQPGQASPEGSAPEQQPATEQGPWTAFQQQKPAATKAAKPEGLTDLGMPTGEIWDAYINNSPIGHVLNAFGQGAKEGWGAPVFNPKTMESLREYGLFEDIDKNQSMLSKAFNEAIVRPAAMTAYQGLRTFEGGMRGISAVLGGVVGAVSEVSPETGKQVEKGLQVAMDPGLVMSLQGMGPAGALVSAPLAAARPVLGRMLAAARSLGVIGEGEEGWKGYTPEMRTPEEQAAIRKQWTDAYRDYNEHEPATEPAGPEPGEPAAAAGARRAAEPTAAKPQTVDDVARTLEPDLFREHDALRMRRDAYSRWIRDLGEEAPENPAIAETQGKIDEMLARVHGDEDRLTNAQRQRLVNMRGDLENMPKRLETPDMAKLRQEMQRLDYRMRDMAPEVSQGEGADAGRRRGARRGAGGAGERSERGERRARADGARGGRGARAGRAPGNCGAGAGRRHRSAAANRTRCRRHRRATAGGHSRRSRGHLQIGRKN
jgi:hypothetical protein